MAENVVSWWQAEDVVMAGWGCGELVAGWGCGELVAAGGWVDDDNVTCNLV